MTNVFYMHREYCFPVFATQKYGRVTWDELSTSWSLKRNGTDSADYFNKTFIAAPWIKEL